VNPAAPKALEAVCRKAMALKPEDRYPSPRALAAEVELWLADEPLQAYREPVAARLGRWARRHKPVVAGSIAVVTTAVITLAVSGWFISLEKVKADEAAAAKNTYQSQIIQLSGQTRRLIEENRGLEEQLRELQSKGRADDK
jgi:ABC-type sulfate/molybdate transport systems ATPase subunit